MDSILRMPGGCFEQTSSSTYPNVLALDYMKRTKKLTPEVHAKAEGYIANGYQRLLTFEVPGGGFSWFGQAPANKILTAYGLMEFNDMSKVSEVDPRLIARTSEWLAGQQQPDGSWKPDTYFINEGATNRYNTDVLRITAYIAWSLANTGYQGAAVDKAKRLYRVACGRARRRLHTRRHRQLRRRLRQDRDFTARSMQVLLDARTENGDQVSGPPRRPASTPPAKAPPSRPPASPRRPCLSGGRPRDRPQGARLHLCAQAGLRQLGHHPGHHHGPACAVAATELNASDVRGPLTVLLDGKTVETLQFTPENNDLLHQFVLKGINRPAPTPSVQFQGTGGLAYQVVGRYFIPWEQATRRRSPLHRRRLRPHETRAERHRHRDRHDPQQPAKTANMVMVDLGIPPGFDLLSEDLQSLPGKIPGRAKRTS